MPGAHHSPIWSAISIAISSAPSRAMPRPTRRSAQRPRSWCEDSVSYRLEIATAMLLAGAIGVGLWAANRSPKPPERDFRSSTYLSGPSGSKALHENLGALGRPSERRRGSPKTLPTGRADRAAILVLLELTSQ